MLTSLAFIFLAGLAMAGVCRKLGLPATIFLLLCFFLLSWAWLREEAPERLIFLIFLFLLCWECLSCSCQLRPGCRSCRCSYDCHCPDIPGGRSLPLPGRYEAESEGEAVQRDRLSSQGHRSGSHWFGSSGSSGNGFNL